MDVQDRQGSKEVKSGLGHSCGRRQSDSSTCPGCRGLGWEVWGLGSGAGGEPPALLGGLAHTSPASLECVSLAEDSWAVCESRAFPVVSNANGGTSVCVRVLGLCEGLHRSRACLSFRAEESRWLGPPHSRYQEGCSNTAAGKGWRGQLEQGRGRATADGRGQELQPRHQT